jgi:2-aminoadipate transaminase
VSVLNYPYARRLSQLRFSEIREILKLTEKPEIISFAGGLPAPELFPVEEIIEACVSVLKENGPEALQYTTTEGYTPLRAWIAARLNKTRGTNFDADNILITGGSQQALDFTGKVFLDEGDVVLCESPTYLAAISAFRAYGCQFQEVPTDDDGMLPDALEAILKATKNVKLIYAIPDFQNPTGRMWSAERRRRLYELSERYGVVVIEDDPYGELQFEGERRPSIKSFDVSGRVFLLGTFSKIFCPGYRIGWIAGDREAITKYVLVKQGADLQCNTLAQREIMRYLELFDIDAHIETIKSAYRSRRDVAVRTMAREFPAEISFTRPHGGLFAWATLPERIDTHRLLEVSLEQKVAFVPGGAFFPNGGHENTMRLNYSNMPETRIEEGLTRLGKIMAAFM